LYYGNNIVKYFDFDALAPNYDTRAFHWRNVGGTSQCRVYNGESGSQIIFTDPADINYTILPKTGDWVQDATKGDALLKPTNESELLTYGQSMTTVDGETIPLLGGTGPNVEYTFVCAAHGYDYGAQTGTVDVTVGSATTTVRRSMDIPSPVIERNRKLANRTHKAFL